jgi:putative DNA primase/helicase
MLEAALRYASQGYAVLPLHSLDHGVCTCGSPVCKAPGKHPRTPRGVLDASTEPEMIEWWWREFPSANIGLRTGDGVAVLDIDPRHGGDASLQRLIEIHGALPDTPTVRTGGGGSHHYFLVPQGFRGSIGRLAGIDVKAEGGYVVAPPSVHASGAAYVWDEAHDLEHGILAALPEWLEVALNCASPKKVTVGQGSGQVTEGSRNATLTSLAGTLRRKGLTADALEAALLTLNRKQCVPPLEDAEVRRIAQSVSRYDAGEHWFALTDIGNAERFVHQHGCDLRYVNELGWVVWDGLRWVTDSTGEVQRRAKVTVRRMYEDAATLAERAASEGDPEQRKAQADIAKHLLVWAKGCEGDARIRALLNRARYEADVVGKSSDFDADAWKLNVRNGTINLRTGKLELHARADLITKLAPVAFDPHATCPTWDLFLEQITDRDAALLRYIRQVVGYTLSGDTREQCLFMLYGTGANGKSTFIEVVNALLGDYARQADFSTFAVRSGESPRNDVARLAGARFVAATETESGQRLSEVVVKQLTGGDTVTARFLHREFFEFRPAFKVFVATNHKPVVRNTDEGIWRRIRLIPFTATIPVERRDKGLKDKLLEELPGILAWAVRGCLDWQEHGLILPERVRSATSGYRKEMDVIAAFIEDECEQAAHARVSPSELYNAYRLWCDLNGERPLAQRRFSQELETRGFSRAKSNGIRAIRGLALRAPAPESS